MTGQTQDKQSAQDEDWVLVPPSQKCPICGYTQHYRKRVHIWRHKKPAPRIQTRTPQARNVSSIFQYQKKSLVLGSIGQGLVGMSQCTPLQANGLVELKARLFQMGTNVRFIPEGFVRNNPTAVDSCGPESSDVSTSIMFSSPTKRVTGTVVEAQDPGGRNY